MPHLTPSEKQWIYSFLIVDAAYWSIVLWTCITNPIECLEASSFGFAFFYLPFTLIVSSLDTFFGYGFDLLALLASGLVCHALIGYCIGHFLQRKPVRYYLSIPIAIVLLGLIVAISMKIAFATGKFI